MAAMRSMWRGTLTLGVVRVPVRVYKATEDRSFTFHRVHEKDGGRIRNRRTCELDGEEIALADIAKAVEDPRTGTEVVVDDAELAALRVPSTREITVDSMIPVDQVDPVLIDRSYYLAPGPENGADTAYVLMLRAMRDAGRVALASWTLRDREHLALVRPHGDVLVLQVLLWPDEVADPAELAPEGQVRIRKQEAAMAASLVDSLAGDLDWSSDEGEYTDSYREAVQAVVDAKVAGTEPPPAPTTRQPAEADLTAALQASLDQARAERTATRGAGRARRTTAAGAGAQHGHGAAAGSTGRRKKGAAPRRSHRPS